MLFSNPRAIRTDYPQGLSSTLNIQRAQESRSWLSRWAGINPGPTPLLTLPDLAHRLGVAAFQVKDESVRSPLASFKALGAPIALVRLILRLKAEHGFDPARLFQGGYADQLKNFTVISATDGNHGRALAAAAKCVGCPCVIVLHANVSMEREHAIAEHGAKIVRIAGNYDESVAEARRLAVANGWHVVSDTSYDGYEEVPRDVMQGYGIIVAELETQASMLRDRPCPFTHVFLQGGVGGLAAAIVSYFWELYGPRRPVFIVVEPEQADCLLQSAIEGRPASARGSVDSVMAGLACGEASPLAWRQGSRGRAEGQGCGGGRLHNWRKGRRVLVVSMERFLESAVDLFMTVPDGAALDGMRLLAAGSLRDLPIVAGESGVAGLAGLQALSGTEAGIELGLINQARVLVINTEGATAPSLYESFVGESASAVLRRQGEWVAR